MRTPFAVIALLAFASSAADQSKYIPPGKPIAASKNKQFEKRRYSLFQCDEQQSEGQVELLDENGKTELFHWGAHPVFPTRWGLIRKDTSWYVCSFEATYSNSNGVWNHYSIEDECIEVNND